MATSVVIVFVDTKQYSKHKIYIGLNLESYLSGHIKKKENRQVCCICQNLRVCLYSVILETIVPLWSVCEMICS